MPKSLVIVESPAKARTISGFLGPRFMVESSIGHIRDLPRNAADIPQTYKKAPWARLGVDVEHGFKPLYVVDGEKKDQIQKLKELLREADELLLATDEDREGESIAWHLLEVLKPKVPVKRMVFHEITRSALENAIRQPREIDRRLVDAQEARRILDRLYGYEVSPVLWKKVMPRLSAGRVQSVATRIIVERERARMRFRAAGYWDVEGVFATKEQSQLSANLVGLGGQRLATGKDFDENGVLKSEALRILTESEARELAESLPHSSFEVASAERKPMRRTPSAPFMTSTLQQEAGRKLKFSSARTMRAAQSLYENGFITYMRTDSTTLSESALKAAREQIRRLYGDEYVPRQPRLYKKKVKNAQEAHEAIRPAGDVFQKPEVVARQVGLDEAKLYELIWMRTVASQMEDARGQSVRLRIAAGLPDGGKAEFAVGGSTITFPGFLRAYVEGSDDPAVELENRERPLPPVEEGETLVGRAFEPKGHETQPPARYTEASLVRRLEELGVGRPSTYASIISTILQRGYVWKKGSALVPSFKAFAVTTLLEQHFGELVDYAFTARMEDELDAIAGGDEEVVPYLQRFYFGSDRRANGEHRAGNGGAGLGLKHLINHKLGEIDARAINSLPLGRDEQGREVVVRVGRYGAYLQRGDDTATIPDDIAPDELTVAKAAELLDAPSSDRELGVDPETGLKVFVRSGRFGPYVQLGEGDRGSKEKPKTSSLLSEMSPQTVTLEDALRLLSLPRTVGADPSDGQPITARLGRYGPYISKGSESRSLEHDAQVFTVTVEEARALLAQPPRKRRAAVEPLREIGTDQVSGKPITLKKGRFGHYVTDGEVNASLQKQDDPETLTSERAQELLQARRERGPAKKKARKNARKNATAKKTGSGVSTKASKKVAKKASKKAAKKASKKVAKKASKKVAKTAGGARSVEGKSKPGTSPRKVARSKAEAAREPTREPEKETAPVRRGAALGSKASGGTVAEGSPLGD